MNKRFPIFFLLFWANSLLAQDLYDYAHSRAYAQYLVRSQQYTLAAEEYERLIFLQPDNDTLRAELLRVYRKGERGQRGLEQWARWQLNPYPKSKLLYSEYAKLLLRGGYPADARTLVRESSLLDSIQIRRTELYANILEQKWREADQSIESIPAADRLPNRSALEKLIRKGEKNNKKDPWLAVALSVPLPGLGKVYAGEWKDGVVSLLMVGVNAWASYRRFDQEGLDTFWGWVHGGFAIGFYAGGLYGAHKAARRHNLQQYNRLKHDAEAIVFPGLD